MESPLIFTHVHCSLFMLFLFCSLCLDEMPLIVYQPRNSVHLVYHCLWCTVHTVLMFPVYKSSVMAQAAGVYSVNSCGLNFLLKVSFFISDCLLKASFFPELMSFEASLQELWRTVSPPAVVTSTPPPATQFLLASFLS